MTFTDYGRAKLLNHFFGGVPMNVPASFYAGFCIGTSSPSAVGAEPGGGGYQRVRLDNIPANWTPAPGQSVVNAERIQWLPATANQGTVYSVALYESPAGGNAWCYFNLPEPRDIATGDAMYIPESVLSIQFQTGIFSNYAKERILAMIFGSTVMPLASTYWVGYSTTAPSDQTPGAEPVGNGYSRVSIPNGLQMFPTSSSGIKTNGQDIVFPESTGNQGLAVGFEFYDAPGGGNRIAYHPSDPLAITNGVAPFIATGSIRFEVI